MHRALQCNRTFLNIKFVTYLTVNVLVNQWAFLICECHNLFLRQFFRQNYEFVCLKICQINTISIYDISIYIILLH